MRSKLFLISAVLFISLLTMDGAYAQNNLDASGKNFFNGLLLKTKFNGSVGKKYLIVGNIMTRHKTLSEKVFAHATVLWAGELEVIDGQVTRANETAGIIEELKETDLDQPGTGINNLKEFLANDGKVLKNKYFLNTDYISYNGKEEHLNENLKYISFFRHAFGKDAGHIMDVVYDGPTRYIKDPNRVKELCDRMLISYEKLISIIPELDVKEWQDIKALLSQIREGNLPDINTYRTVHRAFFNFRDEHAFWDRQKDFQIYTGTGIYRTLVSKLLNFSNKPKDEETSLNQESTPNQTIAELAKTGINNCNIDFLIKLIDKAIVGHENTKDLLMIDEVLTQIYENPFFYARIDEEETRSKLDKLLNINKFLIARSNINDAQYLLQSYVSQDLTGEKLLEATLDKFLSREEIKEQDILALFSMADLIELGSSEYRKYTNINPGGFSYLLSSINTLKEDFRTPDRAFLLSNVGIEKLKNNIRGLGFKK